MTHPICKPTDYQRVSLPVALAEKILAYFRAYAQNAIQIQHPMDTSIRIAHRGGLLNPFNYLSDGRKLRVWSVQPTFWYVVDQYGNGYEHGSEGHATCLTFSYLCRQSTTELKHILDEFDPWKDYS